MSAYSTGDLVTCEGDPYVIIRLDTPGNYALIYPGDDSRMAKTRLMRWVAVHTLTRRAGKANNG